jgi:bleomycin hydrolase
MNQWKWAAIPVAMLLSLNGMAQQPQDKAVFKTYEQSYYRQSISPAVEAYQKKQQADYTASPTKAKGSLKIELSQRQFPTDPAKYKQLWHTSPVSQGNTNTCWCFSTMSYLESEVKRKTGKEVQLSPMYIVYFEYLERAKLFVQKRGNVYIGEGSETNAVTKIMATHGLVPADAYTCLKPGEQFYNHEPLFNEFKAYLDGVKASRAWDEERVVATTEAILRHHLGPLPMTFAVDGKMMTPLQYMNDYLQLKPQEYVDFMSLMEQPYLQQAEYIVPDNWWRSDDYYNAPLDLFLQGIKQGLRKGYTAAIGGDFSEAGIESSAQVMLVPTFDIPSAYINESARQFRFSNQTTTDDHAVHVVGYYEENGKDWFLIKDSGSGSRDGRHKGYYFMHEDFFKLKIMSYTIHKDAVADILAQFKR